MSRKIIAHLQNLLAHEQGAVVREWGHRRPVALVYPHEYQVGMSNLGFQTIYHLLNAHPDLTCERVFLPGEAQLQEYQAQPHTLALSGIPAAPHRLCRRGLLSVF